MKTLQVSARNVEKAIEQGLKELGLKQEDVDIKILEEGGFFKKAKVEIVYEDGKEIVEEKHQEEDKKVKKEEKKAQKTEKKETKKQEKEDKKKEKKEEKDQDKKLSVSSVEEFGVNFLKELFVKMNVEATVDCQKVENGYSFNAKGEKVSTLIGKRGETMNAIQEVLSNVVKNAGFREDRVFFDVEDYKQKREVSLQGLAERMSKKALKINKPIKLERMNAYERKIIHTALQNVEGITTKSEGEEPNRYLVIIPTNSDK